MAGQPDDYILWTGADLPNAFADPASQQLDERNDFLVAIDRSSHHGRLHDLIVRIQNRLDLGGVDVEPGANDEFFGAAGDVEMALTVHPGEIPCVEPALAVDRRRRQLRSTIVAQHHVGAANVQLAHFADRNRPALPVHDPVLDTGKKGANRLVWNRSERTPERPGEHSVML